MWLSRAPFRPKTCYQRRIFIFIDSLCITLQSLKLTFPQMLHWNRFVCLLKCLFRYFLLGNSLPQTEQASSFTLVLISSFSTSQVGGRSLLSATSSTSSSVLSSFKRTDKLSSSPNVITDGFRSVSTNCLMESHSSSISNNIIDVQPIWNFLPVKDQQNFTMIHIMILNDFNE